MTDRARRRQRQKRLVLAGVVAAALAVASGMSVLWRQAVAAAREAQAQRLFALGQLELDKDPTATVAYALASLEEDDTLPARLLALRALWRGPAAFALAETENESPVAAVDFSPDGRWLAHADQGNTGTVRLWQRDGSGPSVLANPGMWTFLSFSGDSRFLVTTQSDAARIYSLPGGKLVRRIEESCRFGFVGGQDLITGHALDSLPDGRLRRLVKIRRLPDGEPEALGVWTGRTPVGWTLDPVRQQIFWIDHARIYALPLRGMGTATPRTVVRSDEPIRDLLLADDERIYTWGDSGAGRIWSRATGARVPGPRIDRPANATFWSPAASQDGRWLAAAAGEAGVILWDLAGPIAAEPGSLRRDARILAAVADPSGSWLAVLDNRDLTLWPLRGPHPHVLRAPERALSSLVVDPQGRFVVAAAGLGEATQAWLWPLRPDAGAERVTLDTGAPVQDLALSPGGDLLAAGTSTGVWLVHLKGGPAERLRGFEGKVRGLVFDAGGRRLAAGGWGFPSSRASASDRVVRVFDLETRQAQVLDPGDHEIVCAEAFLRDGRLLSSGSALRLWDLATGRATVLREGVALVRLGPDGRHVLGVSGVQGPSGAVGTAFVYDLETKKAHPLESHGDQVTCVAWDLTGKLVLTGSRDGIVRVGLATGDVPHLLIGHEAAVRDIVADPQGRWIASAGEDGTVRLWPLPIEGQPFQTLPHDELLARLRSLTNFRVVPDRSAPGGYRLGFERFTGWNRQPPSW